MFLEFEHQGTRRVVQCVVDCAALDMSSKQSANLWCAYEQLVHQAKNSIAHEKIPIPSKIP
jgi:hypothetical protein